MLRSEFPFQADAGVRRVLVFVLGEAFLGFLAIVAAALTLLPMLFPLARQVEATVEACQWGIIAWFGVEYAAGLHWAHARKAYVFNPWRVLDLLTILVPLATIAPTVSAALRSSPVLRLVRLARLVTLGVRVGGVVVRAEVRRATQVLAEGPAQVTLLRPAPADLRRDVPWDELLRWVRAPGREWYHVSNPSPAEIESIAAGAGLPASFLHARLLGTGYPHVESVGPFAGFFVWLPELTQKDGIERRGVSLLVGSDHLLSFSRHESGLLEKIAALAPAPASAPDSFVARMTQVYFRAVLAQNESVVAFFEEELRALEEVPVRESHPRFFERTFRLKKQLSLAKSDLWRLRCLLGELAEGRARLSGVPAEAAAGFQRLADDAAFLFDTIANIREEVLALIDLHLNVVSFDVNRFMRLLAVISALGLIPAVVGGLFGMNLADNPWAFTLPQVTFGVVLGMVLGLYLFFVKGWLR